MATSTVNGESATSASNAFWRLLYRARLTNELIASADYRRLLDQGLGLTDVTAAVSSTDSKLKPADFDVSGFRAEIAETRPKVVAFNGKKAAEVVALDLGETSCPYGLREWKLEGAQVFVLPSSSGTNTRMTFEQKLKRWKELAQLLG